MGERKWLILGRKDGPAPSPTEAVWRPENSLTAFEEAAALGAGGVEMDVRRTRDGKLVVFHDADVRRLTMGWQGPYSSGKVKDMTWEKLSQVRLPFGGHLLKRFPEGGYSNEKQYYYPWAVAPEQGVLYQMERFESRAENEEQVLSAVYRRYKEEDERRCLEDGRLERILSLREFFQWLRTQPEGFFAEGKRDRRGSDPDGGKVPCSRPVHYLLRNGGGGLGDPGLVPEP